MTYIIIWRDTEHEIGEIHYHVKTDIRPKRVFMKFKERLPELLPEGFHIVTYSSPNDIGILDNRHRQHMHICYMQRRFPQNVHITFLRDTFKPIFIQMLQKCFPKTEITILEEADKYTPEDVGYILDIAVHSVSREFMPILLLALSKLPKDVVDWVADNIYFVSSNEDDAFYKSKKELTPWKRGIIVLCEQLKSKSLKEQTFTIAHEIAHAKLNHKATSAPIDHDYQKDEEEADRLAKKWLKRKLNP